jgi:hypothetical protein
VELGAQNEDITDEVCNGSRVARALAIAVPLAVTTWSPSSAQPPAPEPLTLEARLGAKWTDERRIDNRKVPVGERGSRPRPDACPIRPAGPPSTAP